LLSRCEFDEKTKALYRVSYQAHIEGRLEQAAVGYKNILKAHPNDAVVLNLLGALAKQTGDLTAAAELISMAISNDNDNADYHYNLALVFQDLKRNKSAIDQYRLTIRKDGSYYNAYLRLAFLLQLNGDYKESLRVLEYAVTRFGKITDLVVNIGHVNYLSGNTKDALDCYELALNTSPADSYLHLRRAFSLLRLGRYKAGWLEYSWRDEMTQEWSIVPVKRRITPLHNSASDLCGKNIVLISEQGVGDQIMYASIFGEVEKLTSNLSLVVDDRLKDLYRRSFPNIKLISLDQISHYISSNYYAIRIGDLPGLFRNNEESFPGNPYLRAEVAHRNVFRENLKSHSGLKIGLSWRGGWDNIEGAYRRLNIYELLSFKPEGVDITWVPLQYDITDEEAGTLSLRSDFVFFEDLNLRDDFSRVSALISELDYIVTIDNSVAHLAGALGCKVILLLNHGCDWRWVDGHKKSLWYADVCIYRRGGEALNPWCDCFKDVFSDLCGS